MSPSSSAAAEWLPNVTSESDHSKHDWHQGLLMTDRGTIRAVLANAITALRLAHRAGDKARSHDHFRKGRVRCNQARRDEEMEAGDRVHQQGGPRPYQAAAKEAVDRYVEGI